MKGRVYWPYHWSDSLCIACWGREVWHRKHHCQQCQLRLQRTVTVWGTIRQIILTCSNNLNIFHFILQIKKIWISSLDHTMKPSLGRKYNPEWPWAIRFLSICSYVSHHRKWTKTNINHTHTHEFLKTKKSFNYFPNFLFPFTGKKLKGVIYICCSSFFPFSFSLC